MAGNVSEKINLNIAFSNRYKWTQTDSAVIGFYGEARVVIGALPGGYRGFARCCDSARP